MAEVEITLKVEKVEMPAHNYYLLTLSEDITYQEKSGKYLAIYSYDQQWTDNHR